MIRKKSFSYILHQASTKNDWIGDTINNNWKTKWNLATKRQIRTNDDGVLGLQESVTRRTDEWYGQIVKKIDPIFSRCFPKKKKPEKQSRLFFLRHRFDLCGFFRIVFPFSDVVYITRYHLPFAHRCRSFLQYIYPIGPSTVTVI